jgi:aminoglycoside phosphotransferase (APT) family kinase protein
LREQQILQIIQYEHGLDPERIERLRSVSNCVYLVRRGDDELIVKIPGSDGQTSWIHSEIETVRALAQCDLPVPEIVADGLADGTPYCIYRRFGGVPIDGLSVVPSDYWRQCGAFIAELERCGPQLRGLGQDWRRDDWIPLRASLERGGVLSPAIDRELAVCREIYGQMPECFCHGDYTPPQLLFGPNGEFCCLDWERSGPDIALYSLGRFCAMLREFRRNDDRWEAIDCVIQGYYGDRSPDLEAVSHMQNLSDMRDVWWKLSTTGREYEHGLELIRKLEERFA